MFGKLLFILGVFLLGFTIGKLATVTVIDKRVCLNKSISMFWLEDLLDGEVLTLLPCFIVSIVLIIAGLILT